MVKRILIIFVVTLLALTKAQQQLATTNNGNLTITHIDNYVATNRRQYDRNILDFDTQMDNFKQNYAASLDTINMERDMIILSINQNEEKLKPLEVISDLSRKCVTKYRPFLPSAAKTKTQIDECVSTASRKVNSLLSAPFSTRNTLDSYYRTNFDQKAAYCRSKYINLPLNYTMCVVDLVNIVNSYTIQEQKTFASQMEAAQCSGNGNIKQALDCSYSIESRTISSIAEVNTLIEKCLQGRDECKPCAPGYYCSEVAYMYKADVDYNSKVIDNPFYGRYKATECLLLKVV
ncbi:uncharacterized protein ACRADG_009373 [Cochliomyia hominivorax]